MKNTNRKERFTSRVAAVLLALALASSTVTVASPAGAGEATVEISIPKELEQGLESVGIKIEKQENWWENPSMTIGGAIIIAGLIIAYAVLRGKK